MPYTMEDFQRQFVKEHFAKLTPEEREDVIKSLPPEERLAGLSADQKLTRQEQEELLQALPPEKRLAGLSADQKLSRIWHIRFPLTVFIRPYPGSPVPCSVRASPRAKAPRLR